VCLPPFQQAFSEVKAEVRELLAAHRVSQMSMKPVKRRYAFENEAVPHGSQWVLKVGLLRVCVCVSRKGVIGCSLCLWLS
jgi:hypothetical protein